MNESAKVYLPRFPFEANAIRLEAFANDLVREAAANSDAARQVEH
jgi:hypothetical protein